uniref:Uncharacterized protein n=1 Tax=Amphimedon queenslandica TaxID=400682 RepID=A0A1X7UZP4_AMPQE
MALNIQIRLSNWKRHMTASFKWSEKLCQVDNGWRLQWDECPLTAGGPPLLAGGLTATVAPVAFWCFTNGWCFTTNG